MRRKYIFLLVLFTATVYAQVNVNQTEPKKINAFTSYGLALEFNGGYSQSYLIGVAFEEHLFTFRYTDGREWTSPRASLGGSYEYPYRVIRSMSLMYNNIYSEHLRMGFGASLSRGNMRGEQLFVDLSGDKSVIWYEDISYVTIGATYDLTIIPFIIERLQIEIFLRGEVNFNRFYNTIGIGLGYTFPNF